MYFQSNQGIKNLTADEATRIAGIDPDYATRDLFNAIARGEYPSWTLSVQIMTYKEAEQFPWNPFDLTKVHAYYTLKATLSNIPYLIASKPHNLC